MIVFKFILSLHWFDTRSVNLFYPAHFFFAKNIYLKKTVLWKLLKVNLKVCNASKSIIKVFSFQKMALGKLSVFA